MEQIAFMTIPRYIIQGRTDRQTESYGRRARIETGRLTKEMDVLYMKTCAEVEWSVRTEENTKTV